MTLLAETTTPGTTVRAPLYITMDEHDNVAIIVNDGGLPIGTVFPSGLTLVDKVPQAHKVSLINIPEGGEVRHHNVVIGYALKDIRAGMWAWARWHPRQTPAVRSGCVPRFVRVALPQQWDP